jgi:hypothetical protein
VFAQDDGSPQKTASKSVTIIVAAVRMQSTLRIIEASPNAGLTQVMVTARLTDTANGGGLGGRTVSFSPGNVTAETAASGLVTVPLALAGSGQHTIFASFAGDAVYSSSFATTKLTQGQSAGCSYSLLKTSESFAANGGSDTVLIATSGGSCAWVAGSNDLSLATITAGSSGIGTGSVTYSVSANSSSTTIRTGTLSLAGMTFTIVQGLNFNDVALDNTFYTFIGKLSARQVTLAVGEGITVRRPVSRENRWRRLLFALWEISRHRLRRRSDLPTSPPAIHFMRSSSRWLFVR